jgi:hypothetical protein
MSFEEIALKAASILEHQILIVAKLTVQLILQKMS